MITRFLVPLIGLTMATLGAVAAELPHTSPEAQGVSSAAVLAFIEAADQEIDALHSVMIIRHGQVITEGWWTPYAEQSPHMLFSLSKSFTSTAVGLAISEGKFSLDDPILKFFPESAPESPSANLRAMRVRDLLRMNTGQETEPARPKDQSWKASFLQHPVRFKPGTHFLYNTSATYMLSAIVQKTTGQTVLDYLRPRLFDPLGIPNPTWDLSPEGISTGGFGLKIRTEDIARLGILYLQKGQWQGRQIVPAAWVEAATSLQTSNGSSPDSDWDQGYGYQFWRCRNGAFRGDGAYGQYCIVMPEPDTVVAITSGVRDMQSVLNLVWQKLLPALGTGTLPENPEAHSKLQQKLKGLTLAHPKGTAAAPNIFDQVFTFPAAPNATANANLNQPESVVLRKVSEEAISLVFRVNGKDQTFACGLHGWKPGQAAWKGLATQSVSGAGAWTAEDTFSAKLCFDTTPFVYTITLKFTGDKVSFNSQVNVGGNPAREVELIGALEK